MRKTSTILLQHISAYIALIMLSVGAMTSHATAQICPNIITNSQAHATLPGIPCGSSNLCAGWVAPWDVASGTPQYSTAAGCAGDPGYFQMWGNSVQHEAIYQPVTMATSTWYKLRLCTRYMANPGNTTPGPTTFRAYVYNGAASSYASGLQIASVAEPNTLTPVWVDHNEVPVWNSGTGYSKFALDVWNPTTGDPNKVSWGHADSITITPVCCLLRVQANAVPGTTTCCHNIYLTNNVDNVSLYSVTATIQSTPSGFTFSSATAPSGWTQTPGSPAGGTTLTWNIASGANPIQMGAFTGQMCLNNNGTNPFATVLFEWKNKQGVVICTTTQNLKCQPPCISIVGDPSVKCIGDSLGMGMYQLCVAIQNNCSKPATITVAPYGANSISVVSVAPASIPGTSVSTICVTFVDITPAGVTACLRYTARYDSTGCQTCTGNTDSLCVDLPKPCPPCLITANGRLRCIGRNTSGQWVYELSTSVTNNSGTAGVLTIAPGVSGIKVDGVSTATLPTGTHNVTATYTSATSTGTECFALSIVSPTGTCIARVCLDKPLCPDCKCPFQYIVTPRGIAQGGGNTVNVYNALTFASGMKVNATIVSASVTQTCIGGGSTTYVPGATIVSGVVVPYIPASGFGTASATWVNMACPSVVNQPYSLRLNIPNAPGYKCKQVVKFCIRYTFTDCKCNTCDTVICYSLIRKWIPIIDYPGPVLDPTVILHRDSVSKRKDDGAGIQSAVPADKPLAALTMTNATDGVLTVNNPAEDSLTLGTTLRTLTLQPAQGVTVVSMTASGGGWSAGVYSDTGTTSTGTLAPGSSVSFAVKFANDINYKVWQNNLHIAYTVTDFPDTLVFTGDYPLTARTPAAMGGDTVTVDATAGSRRKDVRTFALKFTNGNSTRDSIGSIVIRVKPGMRILAVHHAGPDSTSAVLDAFGSGSNQVIFGPAAPGDGQSALTPVAPGAQIGPIYVTLSGVVNEKAVFDYETHSAAGDVISTGQVTVDNPLGSVGRDGSGDDATATTTITLSDARPNPTNGTTTIVFWLQRPEGNLELALSEATGNTVRKIVDGEAYTAGQHQVTFNTRDLPSGTYYYTLRTQTGTQTRTLVVAR